jgi:hypothetical protein
LVLTLALTSAGFISQVLVLSPNLGFFCYRDISRALVLTKGSGFVLIRVIPGIWFFWWLWFPSPDLVLTSSLGLLSQASARMVLAWIQGSSSVLVLA